MARHRSSAAPLAWLYAALIVYASLSPFVGWRVPGVSPFAFLLAPWWPWWTGFDLTSNLLGYLPLGALVFGALVRSGRRVGGALVLASVAGLLLSLGMEFLQNFLPQRVSSNVDLGLNALGTVLGATLGWALHARGAVERWQAARDRWFIGHSGGGLALLLLWPVGLLFPTPLPFGLGQVWTHVQEGLASGLDGTPATAWVEQWVSSGSSRPLLSPIGEAAVTALGLLAPCLVAYTVSRPGWRRAVLVLGATALGVATTTLSTALNFGPSHALAWNTAHALGALGGGAALALLLVPVSRRVAGGLALVALTALVVLVSQAPSDPYFADSLQAWEQGRFIRFHGAAQWVGWLWPYAAIAYLLARVGSGNEGPGPASRMR